MARRSTGGRSARPAPRHAPAPVRQAPAPAQSGRGGGIGSIKMNGFRRWKCHCTQGCGGFDGSSHGHTIRYETVVSDAPAPTASSMGGSDACSVHTKAFQDCVNNFGTDISKCQFFMDMLSQCKKNNSGMLSAKLLCHLCFAKR